jgi:hypothetical protein
MEEIRKETKQGFERFPIAIHRIELAGRVSPFLANDRASSRSEGF